MCLSVPGQDTRITMIQYLSHRLSTSTVKVQQLPCPAGDDNVGRCPCRVLPCVVMVWRTRRGGSVPRVFTEGSEVSLVTLNLCVMRRYNVGEGDRVSTSIRFDISYLQMCRLVLLTHNKCGRQGMECKTHPIRYKEERCWVYR